MEDGGRFVWITCDDCGCSTTDSSLMNMDDGEPTLCDDCFGKENDNA